MISLTEAAASELRRLLHAKGAPADHGLRLGAEKGGCAGWQYTMEITGAKEGDYACTSHNLHLFVAADSLDLLRDCQIDFSDALSDSGFKIRNPQAVRSCGCGTSFETEKKGPDSPTAQPDGSVCGGD